jgi:hypothetical protein
VNNVVSLEAFRHRRSIEAVEKFTPTAVASAWDSPADEPMGAGAIVADAVGDVWISLRDPRVPGAQRADRPWALLEDPGYPSDWAELPQPVAILNAGWSGGTNQHELVQ